MGPGTQGNMGLKTHSPISAGVWYNLYMKGTPILLFLAVLTLGTSCTKKEEEAAVSAENKKPAARKSGGVVGRGMIVDPRKAKPMLEKTRAAAEAMSKSNQGTQTELDQIK